MASGEIMKIENKISSENIKFNSNQNKAQNQENLTKISSSLIENFKETVKEKIQEINLETSLSNVLNMKEWRTGPYQNISDDTTKSSFGSKPFCLAANSEELATDPVLWKITFQYYQDFTQEDLEKVFQATKKTDVPSCFITTIIKEYADKPEEFKNKFGFELKRTKKDEETGLIYQDYNYEDLLLDFILYTAKQKDVQNISEIYNAETENGLADYNYEDYFASYLQSKGIDNLTITHSSLQLEGLSEQVKDKKMADLKEAIKEGNQVILKINSASYYGLSDKDNDGQFDLKSCSTYPKTINVVGMTDNGYFIVSNCGEFSLLPFDADILQHDILEYKQEEKIDSTSQKLEAEESPSKLDPTPSIFYDFSQIEQILNLNDWSRGIYLLDNNYIGDQPKFQNFGGSQSSLSRNSSQFIEDPIVLDIVKKYYPDVTEEDLELLFYQMNSGGCGYVAFINSIAKEFEDRPEEFEEKFGYELSTIKQDYATGKYFEDYNYEYLFLDYFLYCATKEGYKDVESVYGNAKERREKKEAGDAALDDQQVEVTGLGGISTEKIGSYGADFLKEKGIKITTYSLEDSFLNNSVLNDTTNALFDESLTFSTIRNNLNQGKQVIIGAKNFSLYNV